MTDYAAEQEMELEALEAILMDDLKVVDPQRTPHGWEPTGKVYRVELRPNLEEGVPEPEIPVRVELVFAHSARYPDEPPFLEVTSLQGLSDAQLANLRATIQASVEENEGVAMVYAIISASQEWLDARADEQAKESGMPREEDPAVTRAREDAAEAERIAALRLHGTPVTPEAFEAWARTFEAEREAEREAAKALLGAAPETGMKLTGKQWFLQQEANHVAIEEPELGADEEDGEADARSTWSCEQRGVIELEDDGDFDEGELDEDEDDEDELLDQLAAQKGLK